MRDVPLRFGVSTGTLCDVSFNPRFSRHSKCLSNKAVLSGIQNFAITIWKPSRRLQGVFGTPRPRKIKAPAVRRISNHGIHALQHGANHAPIATVERHEVAY